MELMLLRPLWLLALLPWLWQGWRRRRQRPLLAPAMQAYLLPARGRAIPWLWLATLPVILALAGPALRQQSQTVSSPALDLWLLDLSSSMQAKDLPPDRATRVRLLLQDMLAEAAARQAPHPLGLILFAGDAYLAMPPTRDHQAISLLLPDLRPAIMPLQGSAPERAVALALAQIPPGQQARLLLITDGLSQSQMTRIAALWPCLDSLFCPQSPSPRLDILLANAGESAALPPPPAEGWRLGSALGQTLPAPDGAAMADLAASTGGRLQWLQAGLPSFAPLPMSQTQTGAQSLDLGPWLLLPLLPLALLARLFPGAHWLLLLMVVIFPLLPAGGSPPGVARQEAPLQAFSQGQAARAFQDPVWQGNAWYRAGDYARAVAAYGRADTATAHYNRGNALVWLGDLMGAEQAYLAALKREPGHQDALHNLALLRANPPQAAPSAQAPESGEPPESSATPDNPRPPAPPVLLLEPRLRKEAERRPLIKVEEPW
ncbi:VWA domain-containing protein [Aeromonas sp. Marseille-Q7275]